MTQDDCTSEDLEVHDDLKAVAERWSALTDVLDHPFATWDFNSLWWEHFGADRPLRVLAAQTATGPVLLPLYLTRSHPIRVLRFLGHTAGDLPGPVAPPGTQEAVVRLMHALASRRDSRGRLLADLLLAEQAPADALWSTSLGGHVVTREPLPALDVGGRSWEQVLQGYSRNLRQQVGRRERALRRDHTVTLHRTTDPALLDTDMHHLLRLHALRWGAPGAFAGRRGLFHRAFARRCLDRGWLRLWRLEVDGVPAAAWYGFRFAGQEWFYQSGRDPRFDELRVGFVLLVHTMREAVQDGMTSYQFLRGGEEYKLRLADQQPHVHTVLSGLSGTGRLAATTGGALHQLPPALRRPLARALGK